jgi:hypothetical protein
MKMFRTVLTDWSGRSNMQQEKICHCYLSLGRRYLQYFVDLCVVVVVVVVVVAVVVVAVVVVVVVVVVLWLL